MRALAAFAVFASLVFADEVKKEIYADFNYGQTAQGNEMWVQSIKVLSPEYRSDVKGEVAVEFSAPGMKYAVAKCWRQPAPKSKDKWGSDQVLGGEEITLDSEGRGSFKFDADKFPAGPMNVRIYAFNDDGQKDVCELQLYNKGGVKWRRGIPKKIPEPAKGMQLIYEDDFDAPLSISNDGKYARYSAHKPRFGDFSGWYFSGDDGEDWPFEQVDTYLRIKARKYPHKEYGTTGLIASVNMDGEGIWAKAPFYMECRFTAQSAPGTWPAFWTITHLDQGMNGDELDIVEAYGGVGPGNPNHPGYSVTSHFWNQKDADGNRKKEYDRVVPITEIGGKSYWSDTFHTYGLYVDEKDTVYYFDGIEVLRHPTNDVSWQSPHCFLINYAIGGISGWKIDLERYGNGSDMYVDYVRVFAKEKTDYSQPRPE